MPQSLSIYIGYPEVSLSNTAVATTQTLAQSTVGSFSVLTRCHYCNHRVMEHPLVVCMTVGVAQQGGRPYCKAVAQLGTNRDSRHCNVKC